MSKLNKLIKNPRQFVRDSRVRRHVLLLRRQAERLRPRARSDAQALQLGTGNDWLAGLLAETVPMVRVPNGRTQTEFRVGFRREDQQDLTALLSRLAATENLLVELRGPNKAKHTVHAKRLFSTDDFLMRHGYFTICVRSRETDELPQIARLQAEFWNDNETHYTAARRNPYARRLAKHTVQEQKAFEHGHPLDVVALSTKPLPDQCLMDVDVVYTWVNHRDPNWQRLYSAATGELYSTPGGDAHTLDRFLSREELRYSLRSIAEFAPWVRRIHIVSNCAAPPWLDLSHPKLRWVDHRDILPSACLPTFSSHAIEARLHHVPDLAEHFLYFNDDFFLCRPATPEDFFFSNGLSKSFVEEYGVVNGTPHPLEPDYLNAARNGQRLIEARFNRTPTALHKHTPYALRRSVLDEMERAFPEEYARTTASAFRSISDISTVSFLYHHYAYLTGRALYAARNAMLIKYNSSRYASEMAKLVEGKSPALSVCINDGQGSAEDSRWDTHVRSFLDAMYGEPCEFERPSAPASHDHVAWTRGPRSPVGPANDRTDDDGERAFRVS